MRPGSESPYFEMSLEDRAMEYCDVLRINYRKYFDSPSDLSDEVDAVVSYTEEEDEAISQFLD